MNSEAGETEKSQEPSLRRFKSLRNLLHGFGGMGLLGKYWGLCSR
jgi:hypothetical protein